ncbi:MAG: PAS domain S-box protein, partial [Firmicutes bacterium]|nr:PAS domain S-box protein [Bacillota bacterium]
MGNLEEKEQSIIESIQDAYCEIDLAGTFTRVNHAACNIFGYTKDEIIGVNYRDYTDEANAEKAFKAFNEIYSTGSPGKLFDYELTRKDGTKRQVELFASLIKDESGTPLGFRGTARDITERKQMEERLWRSAERYRTIIEDMEDAYFELDLRGRFTFANNAVSRQLGYSSSELIGMSNRRYANRKNVREMAKVFSGVYRTGISVKTHAFELIRKDGSKFYAEISVSLIRNKKGEAVGFRGIARDVTERSQMEEKIRRSEERYRTIIEDME